MNELPKLVLSAEELALASNTQVILTKHKITQTVQQMFSMHAALAQQHLAGLHLPTEVKNSSPKISKGENYLQLPWVMLDYPRVFTQQNIFAIRTMFWWGNFFSCTLHVSGKYKQQFETSILTNISNTQYQQFFICNSNDEWQHHFEPNNYITVESCNQQQLNELLQQKNFIKISCKFSLEKWVYIPELMMQSLNKLLMLVGL
jgi:hypothetical protein